MEQHKKLEQALIDSKKNMYGIYQLKNSKDLHEYWFNSLENLKKSGKTVDKNNYNIVYADVLGNESLEDIYEKFNINCPKDFYGHSLSVATL